jgi:hypothetical protein
MYKIIISFLVSGIILFGCSKTNTYLPDNNSTNLLEYGWSVPLDQLVLSQLPMDRIKSIDKPHFEILSNATIERNEVVYIYQYGDTIKIYPETILAGHEVVNDRIGNHFFAITYCPLTGSAIVWNREVNGIISEFGVSGHLYNENLIAYDRNDTSYWSQMLMHGIKGINDGEVLDNYQLFGTSGSTAEKLFPNALVLVDSLGHVCADSICGRLKINRDFVEPSDNDNIVLHSSDYFGIVNTNLINGGKNALLVNYDIFADSISIYQTTFSNSDIIILGSNTLEFIVAFENNTNYSSDKFYAVQNSLPIIFADSSGNKYNVMGVIVSGPNRGNRLPSPKSYSAHSFAWELFYNSSIEIFEK